MCTCLHGCVWRTMEARGQLWMSFSIIFHPSFWDGISRRTSSLMILLDWPTASPQGSSFLFIYSAGLKACATTSPHGYWGLSLDPQFTRQTLYLLHLLLRPKNFLLLHNKISLKSSGSQAFTNQAEISPKHPLVSRTFPHSSSLLFRFLLKLTECFFICLFLDFLSVSYLGFSAQKQVCVHSSKQTPL